VIEDILTAANLDKFGDDSRWVQVSLDEVVDCSELIHCALKTQWQKKALSAQMRRTLGTPVKLYMLCKALLATSG